ncbi:homeobox protein HOX3-like [Stylophora pistillata]|uniref:homeobox protein HOX3-like n=1 Tax=Stylophora pistillata TaxID=50429 RepID=UPI000C04FA56|nr:homeobox protein HOX3-like [Stylophora pistillata]
MQKEKLEAMFLKTKYPSRAEKATMAATLDITINKVQTWFCNRRQKWRKQQKKGVGPSACPSVLPRVSVVNRSYKSTASLECYSQFPRQRQEHSQPLSYAPYQATVPFASSPQTCTQSFASCNQIYSQECQPKLMSSQRHFSSKQHPVPNLPVVTETISPPYSLFPHLTQRIPQLYPDAYPPSFYATDSSGCTVQQPEPSQTTCQPMEVFQASQAAFTRLADEFPFSYATAKEMPHIFGEIEDDEVLGCPLTPSFDCSSDLALRREFVLRESCHFSSITTDFSNRVSPT